MRYLLTPPARRLVASTGFTLLLLVLGACGDLAAALPARPTPVPTLARLPSVTPVTPSPTRLPTVTPAPTATPEPLRGAVARNANVRGGPGTDFAIVGVLDAGASVLLLRRSGDWYEVSGPDGVAGWMAGSVLEIDPATDAAVPVAAP